ncbi:uncharacterized protein TNCV_2116951 [Trichonephila clavipes]|nr:uncharacterized protein TNCV_2116951 [Trichonephila clavipes]
MDVCKCTVPFRHGGFLNSRQAVSPFVRLVEGEQKWEAPDSQGVLRQNWGGNELNLTVTTWCSRLLLTTGVHLALCHDEFQGHGSDKVEISDYKIAPSKLITVFLRLQHQTNGQLLSTDLHIVSSSPSASEDLLYREAHTR